MKTNLTNLFFFLAAIFLSPCFSQNQGDAGNRRMDSLQTLLANAKQDTDKIRLSCLAGLEAKIKRVPFWDSILLGAQQHNMPLTECRAWRGKAILYRFHNNMPKAIDCFNKSLKLAERYQYKDEIIQLLRRLWRLHHTGNDKKKALDLNYYGLKIAEELGDKKAQADFYANIALCYFFSNDIHKALDMHFNCLRLYKELKNSHGIAGALSDIGSDYIAIGDRQKAIHYYLECGKYAPQLGQTPDAAACYNSVASAYEMLRLPDSAYKYSLKAYQIFQLNKDTINFSGAMDVMAKALYQKGDVKGAKKLILEAMGIARSVRYMEQIPDLALSLKKIYTREKDFEKALEAYELYISSRDSISNEKIRKQALQKEFAYNFEKKVNEVRLLAQQNEIQQLQINQGKYMMIALAGLLLIVVVMGYLIVRQNRLKAQQQSFELEQKLLRSQMNPHFIFNSLNSIQQLIISRHNEQAESYLAKFARLIRELLESNMKENLSLKEEISILAGYMEMESLRFKKQFSYRITVAAGINEDEILIPPMLIQPFIENAIWHGLLSKTGDRNLTVSFERDSDRTLCCIVDDNGIGREKSRHKEVTFKKQSLALSYIQQRLELLRKTFKINCRVTIEDKVNAQGEAEGTRVIAILPILNNS